jgi:2-phosphosulfolactate phosphatase
MPSLEVLFAPAEFMLLARRDLRETVCVVFDVLRATSTMITALANGAKAIYPVSEIGEALELRQRDPEILLAGEREGFRIEASAASGAAFDFGNSPREFTSDRVSGRTIATTTTNGTRALRSCVEGRARLIHASAFLNLNATAELLLREKPENLLLVCSGTHDQAAGEDILAAGALVDLLWQAYGKGTVSDSALIAHQFYQLEAKGIQAAMSRTRNGRRLLSLPDLRDDVAFCAKLNAYPIVAALDPDGAVRRK